jgi:hypothetical protein
MLSNESTVQECDPPALRRAGATKPNSRKNAEFIHARSNKLPALFSSSKNTIKTVVVEIALLVQTSLITSVSF